MTIRCNRSAAPIEHPAAYANAVKRNIIMNARKTWLAKTLPCPRNP
jgi:hypothetical protein